MSFRKTRIGKITHIGPLPKHIYEARDGAPTLVNFTYIVHVVIEVQDGPDKGREIRLELDDQNLSELVQGLSRAGAAVEAKREETGA